MLSSQPWPDSGRAKQSTDTDRRPPPHTMRRSTARGEPGQRVHAQPCQPIGTNRCCASIVSPAAPGPRSHPPGTGDALVSSRGDPLREGSRGPRSHRRRAALLTDRKSSPSPRNGMRTPPRDLARSFGRHHRRCHWNRYSARGSPRRIRRSAPPDRRQSWGHNHRFGALTAGPPAARRHRPRRAERQVGATHPPEHRPRRESTAHAFPGLTLEPPCPPCARGHCPTIAPGLARVRPTRKPRAVRARGQAAGGGNNFGPAPSARYPQICSAGPESRILMGQLWKSSRASPPRSLRTRADHADRPMEGHNLVARHVPASDAEWIQLEVYGRFHRQGGACISETSLRFSPTLAVQRSAVSSHACA